MWVKVRTMVRFRVQIKKISLKQQKNMILTIYVSSYNPASLMVQNQVYYLKA